ncbi:hypothetical protein E4T56_gene6576, partial [Termitomyces sp. T112]
AREFLQEQRQAPRALMLGIGGQPKQPQTPHPFRQADGEFGGDDRADGRSDRPSPPQNRGLRQARAAHRSCHSRACRAQSPPAPAPAAAESASIHRNCWGFDAAPAGAAASPGRQGGQCGNATDRNGWGHRLFQQASRFSCARAATTASTAERARATPPTSAIAPPTRAGSANPRAVSVATARGPSEPPIIVITKA